jgi:hypothetical protein
MEKFNKIFVIIGGVNFLFWGLFHLTFRKALDWKNELQKLTELNSNVMQMLNIGIAVFMLAFGISMLVYQNEFLYSALGRALLIIFALFWLARLVREFAFPGGSIIVGFVLFLCVQIYLIPAIIVKQK